MFELAAKSSRRNSSLLVLGYHGVSLEDEHLWNGALYLSPETFRSRIEAIRRHRCSVLDLGQALQLLSAGDLPERAVVLTFDDGTCDFHKIVWPILKEYRYPATVYVTTYWMSLGHPVVPVTWSYLFWKARNSGTFDLGPVLGGRRTYDLRHQAGRDEAVRVLMSFSASEHLDGEQQNAISVKLATMLRLDFDALRSKRILQLMKPEELHELSGNGASVQLHMHRHRSPDSREMFLENLRNNYSYLNQITSTAPSHFCYPNGLYKPQFLPWLREFGVKSATTCDPGLASSKVDPLLLPR